MTPTLEALQAQLAAHPESVELNYQVGCHYLDQGAYAEAVEYLERASRGEPHAQVFVTLGEALARAQQSESAVQALDRAVELGFTNPEILEQVANGYALLYRYGEAVGFYSQTVKLEPDNLAAHRQLGVLCQRLGQSEKAIESLEKVRDSGHGDAEVLAALARAYHEAHQLAKAAVAYEASLQLNPNPKDLFALAKVYLNVGRIDLGIERLRGVAQAEPSNIECLFTLARNLMLVGKMQEGQNLFRETRQRVANPLEDHLFRGVAHLRKDSTDAALGEFEAALKVDGECFFAHAQIGELHLAAGNYRDARGPFKAALKVCPKHVPSLHGLGVTFCRASEYEIGLNFFADALRGNPYYKPTVTVLGEICRNVLGPGIVADCLEEVMNTFPLDLKVRGGLVQTWLRTWGEGYFDLAAELFARLCHQFPGDDRVLKEQARMHTARAMELGRAGHVQPAIEVLEKLLASQPGHPEAVHIMAELRSHVQAQQAEALQAAEQAAQVVAETTHNEAD